MLISAIGPIVCAGRCRSPERLTRYRMPAICRVTVLMHASICRASFDGSVPGHAGRREAQEERFDGSGMGHDLGRSLNAGRGSYQEGRIEKRLFSANDTERSHASLGAATPTLCSS